MRLKFQVVFKRALYGRKKIHIDELEIDEMLVKDLLSTQFPQWALLPLKGEKIRFSLSLRYRDYRNQLDD
jgi:hypothetical protein